MGVVAFKLAGVVNKSGRGRKIFRARFARRLFSTLLDEILDTPLLIAIDRVDNKKLKFRKPIFSQPWHVYLTDSRLNPS